MMSTLMLGTGGALIDRIAANFPRRVIGAERGSPLLIRYFLLRSAILGIYLHKLCRSDEDRALHDHPWTFVSIILTGGYIEHTPDGQRRYWPGAILYRPAEWQHRLELDRPAWTLVFRFRRRREWGFHCPGGWVHWLTFDQQGGCEIEATASGSTEDRPAPVIPALPETGDVAGSMPQSPTRRVHENS